MNKKTNVFSRLIHFVNEIITKNLKKIKKKLPLHHKTPQTGVERH